MKEVSKKIKKCIRDNQRSRRQEKIQRILEAFRGIKNISNIKSAKKKTLIPKVNNEKGETVTSRKGIANVFGKFCSKLYAGNDLKKKSGTVTDMKQEMPEFTKNEVQAAIDSLKKGKASDSNGIRAEDIKACGEATKEMIRQIFNEVPNQEDCTPTTWRRIRIKVIRKKGDVEEAGNYRPICNLPALYKLFSTHSVQQTLSQTRPRAAGGPGRVSAILPNARPSGGVQIDRTYVPVVGCQNVGRDDGHHEGI